MKKLTKRLLCTALALATALGGLVACGGVEDTTDTTDATIAAETKYNAACAMLASGNYESAYAAFMELGDYKDSQDQLDRFVYFPSVVNYELYDRSGVMTVELGMHNLPTRVIAVGTIGTKDSAYTYDEEGRMLQQSMNYDGALSAYDYIYDAYNRLIKANYTEEGVVCAVNEYVYNDKGQVVRESYVTGDVVYYDYVNTYDERGNRIESKYEAAEGDYVYTYVFAENDNLVNHRGETPGYLYNVDYLYNDKNQRVQEVLTENGELSHTINYTYDSEGRRVREECCYADGTKGVYEREFDANGNVAREVLTEADGSVQTVEWTYVFTYLTIDVPESTMDQLGGLFDIL